MLNDLFKCPQHLVQQSVERMLKQMLKPFKRTFTLARFEVDESSTVSCQLYSSQHKSHAKSSKSEILRTEL